MMKTSRNKEASRIWNEYQNSTTHSVLEAYKTRPSVYKESAEKDILQEMQEGGGYDYRIISHNGFMFTCGYLVEVSPNHTILVYHTKGGRKCIALDGEYKAGYTK